MGQQYRYRGEGKKGGESLWDRKAKEDKMDLNGEAERKLTSHGPSLSGGREVVICRECSGNSGEIGGEIGGESMSPRATHSFPLCRQSSVWLWADRFPSTNPSLFLDQIRYLHNNTYLYSAQYYKCFTSINFTNSHNNPLRRKRGMERLSDLCEPPQH